MTEPVPIRNRLPSRMDLFATNLKQDIRAHQRTYEGHIQELLLDVFPFRY